MGEVGQVFFGQYLTTFWPMFPDRISWAENIVVGRLRGVWECGWGDDRKPVNVLGQYQWTNVAVWRTLRIWVACSDLIGFCGKFLQLLQRTPIAPVNSYCSSDLLPNHYFKCVRCKLFVEFQSPSNLRSSICNLRSRILFSNTLSSLLSPFAPLVSCICFMPSGGDAWAEAQLCLNISKSGAISVATSHISKPYLQIRIEFSPDIEYP